jgi:ribosome-associated translation inhibitor RaiA
MEDEDNDENISFTEKLKNVIEEKIEKGKTYKGKRRKYYKR